MYLSPADDYNVVWITSGDSESTLTSVKYLHQLQNLYYSLTGTELEITTLLK
jgi:hypothetical protein